MVDLRQCGNFPLKIKQDDFLGNFGFNPMTYKTEEIGKSRKAQIVLHIEYHSGNIKMR